MIKLSSLFFAGLCLASVARGEGVYIASPSLNAVLFADADSIGGTAQVISGSVRLGASLMARMPDGSRAYSDLRGGRIYVESMPPIEIPAESGALGSYIPRVTAIRPTGADSILFATAADKLCRAAYAAGSWSIVVLDSLPTVATARRAAIAVLPDGRAAWLSDGKVRLENGGGGFDTIVPAVAVDLVEGPGNSLAVLTTSGYRVFDGSGTEVFTEGGADAGVFVPNPQTSCWDGGEPPLAAISGAGLLFADDPMSSATLRSTALADDSSGWTASTSLRRASGGRWEAHSSSTQSTFLLDPGAGTATEQFELEAGSGTPFRGVRAVAVASSGVFVLDGDGSDACIVRVDPTTGDRALHAELAAAAYLPFLAQRPDGSFAAVSAESEASGDMRLDVWSVTPKGRTLARSLSARTAPLDCLLDDAGDTRFLLNNQSGPDWEPYSITDSGTGALLFRSAPALLTFEGELGFETASFTLESGLAPAGSVVSPLLRPIVPVSWEFDSSSRYRWLELSGPTNASIGNRTGFWRPFFHIQRSYSGAVLSSEPRLHLLQEASTVSISVRTMLSPSPSEPDQAYSDLGILIDRAPGATQAAQWGGAFWHYSASRSELAAISSSGVARHALSTPSRFQAGDLAVDSIGRAYLSSVRGDGAVYRFDPGTGAGEFISTGLPPALASTDALLIGGGGGQIAIGPSPAEFLLASSRGGWLLY
jgi:hypothetical protein